MRSPAVVFLLGVALLGAGCRLCERESVQVSFTGTAGGQVVNGVEAVSSADIADYPVVRDFLIDGAAASGAVTWRVRLTDYGSLSVTLPGSMRRGDVLVLGGVARVQNWGLSTSADSRALGSFQSADGAFVTASAQGTVTVTGTDPLRLRVDGVFANQAGTTRTISGDAAFRTVAEERECFT